MFVEFNPGDFVVVENRVGSVHNGKIYSEHLSSAGKYKILCKIEVWFGDLTEGGLPKTKYVEVKGCTNIKLTRMCEDRD